MKKEQLIASTPQGWRLIYFPEGSTEPAQKEHFRLVPPDQTRAVSRFKKLTTALWEFQLMATAELMEALRERGESAP